MYKQLTCLIVMGLVIGITPSQAALVHHWKLDDTGAMAVDSVGGLNGDITGAMSVPGKAGNALSFDGTGDEVAITRQLAVEAWALLNRRGHHKRSGHWKVRSSASPKGLRTLSASRSNVARSLPMLNVTR